MYQSLSVYCLTCLQFSSCMLLSTLGSHPNGDCDHDQNDMKTYRITYSCVNTMFGVTLFAIRIVFNLL